MVIIVIPQHILLTACHACPPAPPFIYATLCKVLGGLLAFYFQKLWSSHEPCLGPQCCLCNFLVGQSENDWREKVFGTKSLKRFRPSSPVFPKTCATTLTAPARVAGRHTMPAKSPPVGDTPSRELDFQGQSLPLWELACGPFGPKLLPLFS